jgi:hypothetical protein
VAIGLKSRMDTRLATAANAHAGKTALTSLQAAALRLFNRCQIPSGE